MENLLDQISGLLTGLWALAQGGFDGVNQITGLLVALVATFLMTSWRGLWGTAAGATVVRRSGIDRYATSVAITNAAFGSSSTIYVAAGASFPDALAGAAAAAKTRMPLYLSFTDCLPKAVRESITAKNATKLVVLGGTGALTDRVRMMYYCG